MTRYEELLDNGPGIPLPQGVTVRFVDLDENHIKFQDCPVDEEGFVVVQIFELNDILNIIPEQGSFTRDEIEKFLHAAYRAE